MGTSNRASGITAENTDMDTIKEDLATLKSDFTALLSDLADGGKHAAQKGANVIADSAKSTAEHAKAVHTATCDTVKDHPMASLLIAAGVGAIATRLFFNGSR